MYYDNTIFSIVFLCTKIQKSDNFWKLYSDAKIRMAFEILSKIKSCISHSEMHSAY